MGSGNSIIIKFNYKILFYPNIIYKRMSYTSADFKTVNITDSRLHFDDQINYAVRGGAAAITSVSYHKLYPSPLTVSTSIFPL